MSIPSYSKEGFNSLRKFLDLPDLPDAFLIVLGESVGLVNKFSHLSRVDKQKVVMIFMSADMKKTLEGTDLERMEQIINKIGNKEGRDTKTITAAA